MLNSKKRKKNPSNSKSIHLINQTKKREKNRTSIYFFNQQKGWIILRPIIGFSMRMNTVIWWWSWLRATWRVTSPVSTKDQPYPIRRCCVKSLRACHTSIQWMVSTAISNRPTSSSSPTTIRTPSQPSSYPNSGSIRNPFPVLPWSNFQSNIELFRPPMIL